MAEDILEEIDDDFDNGSMEDLLDDSLEDSIDQIGTSENKSSKKKIILIVLFLVLLTGLAVGIWLFFFKESPKEDQDVQKPIPIRQEDVVFEDIVELEPFEYIQLKAGSTMALISMNLSLELIDHRFRKQVYTMEDRIRKVIAGQVEEMTWLELRNSEGKIIFKYNLLKQINSIFPTVTVRNIYFTNFIMQ